MIDKYFLNSDHQSLVVITPSKTAAKEEADKVAAELARYKQSLSPEALQQLVQSTKKLMERQAAEDRPEDLRKLPMLSLADIDKKAERLPSSETEIDGVKTLFHEMATNKIAYLNLYFDASAVPENHLPYLALLEETLGKVDTQKYKYGDLVNAINIQTGGIDFENHTFADKDHDDRYQPKFAVHAKVLMDKLPQSFELIHEILFNSRFDDQSRIKEIIKEVKSRLEMIFNQNGQSVVVRRLGSYFSAASRYSEQLGGLGFYHFICDLDKNLADRFAGITQILSELTDHLFAKNRLVISVTGDQANSIA
ncbi:hypothetical protein QS257_04950 [Terrilactibacillus sp. S3-3]|nr:hypothetical protein QS257_04950 [Terrilactibacillus sp. S3-3]